MRWACAGAARALIGLICQAGTSKQDCFIVDFAAVYGRWGAGAGAPLARLLLRALPPGVGYGIMCGNRCGGGIASSAAADGTDAARSGCGVKSQLFRF